MRFILKQKEMIRKLILWLIAIAACQCAWAQDVADADVVRQVPRRDGWSAHLAFELTTPTGSQGRWSTGGGATLTLSYTHFFTDRLFISPGVGAFYNSMGTDFFPEYENAYEGTVRNYGIRVPLLGGLSFKLSDNFTLSLATGPIAHINIIAREKATPDFSGDVAIDPPGDINLFHRGFKRIDLGWEVFGGITYRGRYSVGISGAIGITPVATMSDAQRRLDIRRNNFAVHVAYTF